MNHPTIPQLAKSHRVPRRTMFRRLLVQHHRDRETHGEKFEPWLYRWENGPWRVNLSRLRALHPEFFEAPTAEELDRRLTRVERQVERVDAGHRKLAKTVHRMVTMGHGGTQNARSK